MDSSSSSSTGSGSDARVEAAGSLCCVCHNADDEGLGSTDLGCCANSEPRSVRDEEDGFIDAGGTRLGERGREASPLETDRECREELA